MATFPQRPLGSMTIALSSTVNFKLDRVAAYRRLTLKFVVNITTGASAPTYTEDALLRFIKQVKITRNGSDVKFVASAKAMFYVEKYEKGTAPYKVDPTTATTTTANAVVFLTIDFASNRKNIKDVSAVMKAKGLSQLDLDITFGAASDIASANAPTINTGATTSFVEIQCTEVIGDVVDSSGATVDVLASNPIDLRFQEQLIALDNSAHSSFDSDTQAINVTPAPATIVTEMFMWEDSSNNKSDTICTALKIQREVGAPVRIIEGSYDTLHQEVKAEYSQEALDTGIIFFDYLDKLAIGLINNGNEGDLKYRILKASSTTATLRRITRYVSLT